ncbi:HAD family hydrolase [Cohnella sp. 56]|uniref:HAD family hydrolase n=1 Tax=Cohnella sp. 56 TaxID=3113722 RepID=UPI0030E83451
MRKPMIACGTGFRLPIALAGSDFIMVQYLSRFLYRGEATVAMIKAVVFDFDGTILDTETVAYEAVNGVFRERGHELPLDKWTGAIGTLGGFDGCSELSACTGQSVEREWFDARFGELYAGMVHQVPLLPGIRDALEEAKRLGLAVGLATSSYRAWIEPHLDRLDLHRYFDVIHTADDVERVKPDPALYRLAVRSLGVEPGEAVAIEDSLHGLRAAKGAGLYGIVVPNAMTAGLDFSEADLVVPTLDGQKLEMLVARWNE